MMKIIKNRLKKCCTATQIDSPAFALALAVSMVPGYRTIKRSTDSMWRKPLADATITIKPKNPIGNNQSRLNHLLRPTRTWGGDAINLGDRPSPRRRIGNIFAGCKLRPETRHHVGRDLRPRGPLPFATLLRFRHQSSRYARLSSFTFWNAAGRAGRETPSW